MTRVWHVRQWVGTPSNTCLVHTLLLVRSRRICCRKDKGLVVKKNHGPVCIREWGTWTWGGCWCEYYSVVRYTILLSLERKDYSVSDIRVIVIVVVCTMWNTYNGQILDPLSVVIVLSTMWNTHKISWKSIISIYFISHPLLENEYTVHFISFHTNTQDLHFIVVVKWILMSINETVRVLCLLIFLRVSRPRLTIKLFLGYWLIW